MTAFDDVLMAEQRFGIILTILSEEQTASVARLCELTGAKAAIRRDLSILAREGRLSKVHGGAMQRDEEFHGEEPDMETKRRLYTLEKDRIARYAAQLLEEDDLVFLDAGSTVVGMAERLQVTRALFVTNGIECARRLMERGLRTHLPGGALKTGTVAIVGTETLESLSSYNFTKALPARALPSPIRRRRR